MTSLIKYWCCRTKLLFKELTGSWIKAFSSPRIHSIRRSRWIDWNFTDIAEAEFPVLSKFCSSFSWGLKLNDNNMWKANILMILKTNLHVVKVNFKLSFSSFLSKHVIMLVVQLRGPLKVVMIMETLSVRRNLEKLLREFNFVFCYQLWWKLSNFRRIFHPINNFNCKAANFVQTSRKLQQMFQSPKFTKSISHRNFTQLTKFKHATFSSRIFSFISSRRFLQTLQRSNSRGGGKLSFQITQFAWNKLS